MVESDPNEISKENYEKAQKKLIEEEERYEKIKTNPNTRGFHLSQTYNDLKDVRVDVENAKGWDEAIKQNEGMIELKAAKEEAEAQMLEELKKEGVETENTEE